MKLLQELGFEVDSDPMGCRWFTLQVGSTIIYITDGYDNLPADDAEQVYVQIENDEGDVYFGGFVSCL